MTRKPTLEQHLRFIDLSLEVAKEAARRMPSSNTLFPTDDALPAPNRKRMALIRRLRIEAMEREGLPMELLPPAERPVSIGEAA